MPYADPNTQRKFQREWRARRRAAWFADKACVECGTTEKLELHHVDPDTKISHSIWSWSEARRNTELAKCIVLCDPCHEEETADYREIDTLRRLLTVPHRHPGLAHYRRGCRCDDCRAEKKRQNNAYRKALP